MSFEEFAGSFVLSSQNCVSVQRELFGRTWLIFFPFFPILFLLYGDALRVMDLFEFAERVRLLACAFGCPDDSIELVPKFAIAAHSFMQQKLALLRG